MGVPESDPEIMVSVSLSLDSRLHEEQENRSSCQSVTGLHMLVVPGSAFP